MTDPVSPDSGDAEQVIRDAAAAAEVVEVSPPVPALISDDELAARFTARHGAEFRHVAAWGHWFAWTGQVWRREDTLQVFDLARAICRRAADETAKPADRPKIASAQRVSAVERLARADRQQRRDRRSMGR